MRVDPRGLLHADAFIQNYYRAVDLENAAPLIGGPEAAAGGGGVSGTLLTAATATPSSSSRSEVMEGLLEQFRGWRDGRRGRVVAASAS